MDRDTVLLIVAGILVVLMAIGHATTFLAILLISKETSKIPELINRSINAEMVLQQLAEDVNMEINDDSEVMWRSADGKYQGSSFEDLLHKMSTDPDGPLSADEIEAIKSVFDKIAGQPDDDEPQEPWRKK